MSTADNNNAQGQPCANPECGFTGHAGFDNYCSVCFKSKVNKSPRRSSKRDSLASLKEEAKDAETAMERDAEDDIAPPPSTKASSAAEADGAEGSDGEPVKQQKNRKRCFECRKKVGVLGFECRCGFVYCGKHRYPEEHACDFDHAGFDRNRLVKSTQKVEAKKVDVL